MRQPGRHWVVALFLELPAAWQTRPGQHCESFRHFDCGSGGHSGYFKPGGIALRNLARIALGDPAGVTR